MLLRAKHKQLNYIYATKVACAQNLSLQVREPGNSVGTGRPSLNVHRLIPAWEAYPLLKNLNKNGAGDNSQGGSFTVKIFLNFQLTLKADAEFYYTGL